MRALRKSLELGPDDLARVADISTNHLLVLERNTKRVNKDTVRGIVRALNRRLAPSDRIRVVDLIVSDTPQPTQ